MQGDQDFKAGDRVVKGYHSFTVTENRGDGILSAVDEKCATTLLATHEVSAVPQGWDDQADFVLPW
jgi:hypothetical protein